MPPAARPLAELRPSSRYRRGAHDYPEARAEHTRQSREWRRQLADAEFGPAHRAAFLAALGMASQVKPAAELVGVTAARVYGRMSWDPGFAGDVERMLAQTCVGRDHCSTVRGYRDGGRCAGCRAAKAADRGARRRRA